MSEEFKIESATTRIKTTLSAIVLVLMLAFSLLAVLPITNAHSPPWTLPTHCYVNVSPNPVGVGQQALILFWVDKTPPTANGAYGDRWDGYTVEITKPDGTKQTLGPFTSDPVGGAYTTFTPNQAGTYTVVSKFPQQTAVLGPISPSGWRAGATDWVNDTYLGSTSDPAYLIVQQNPIPTWTEAPLPSSYWTRPIYMANRNWGPLAGNWLAGAAQTKGSTTSFAYGTGPETAHIMWSKELWAGGVMDARFGNLGYTTIHYEGTTFSPPIIIDGRIYYNSPEFPMEGWYCLDLYTGEQLWYHNTTGPIQYGGNSDTAGMNVSRYPMLSFGQILEFDSPNQHGGFPYLWVTYHPSYSAPYTFAANNDTWQMYDAFTGNWICDIIHAPTTGTAVYGNDGTILRYNIVNLGTTASPNRYLQIWNTSQAILYRTPAQYASVPGATSYWLWRPVTGATFDGLNGYSLNVTVPDVQGSILAVRDGQYIIGGTAGSNTWDNVTRDGNLWALSLKPGQEGTLLWNITFTPPPFPQRSVTSTASARMDGPTVYPEENVFVFSDTTTRRLWGYSLQTGKMMWGPTAPEVSYNYYGMNKVVYQGKLMTFGYGGVLMAYDIQTGKVVWNYTAQGVPETSPYGQYPLSLGCVADGKLYMYTTDHSPNNPLFQGSYVRCIDVSTGAELWKIQHWGPVVASDGYLLGLDSYDNQLYCYGKGPSATKVTAPDVSTQLGSSVIIRGTVTDQSLGAKDTPAIADESMSAWMEYLYKQQGIPADAKGVTVKLTAIDPNGNNVDIATVTSDMSGMFYYKWTPPLEGAYKIIATFEGTKSYWPSYAETALGVDAASSASPAVAPTATPTATPTLTSTPAVTPSPANNPEAGSNTAMYIGIAAVVIIVAIAAVAVILRRRK